MSTVKCVVWDLDGTVWPGVAIEAPEGAAPPRPFPRALRTMALLEERGIVSSAASRTDPSLARAVHTHAELSARLVAPQLGWGHKSDALLRIADQLGVAPAAMAFVDDNPFERAEVAAMLPEVLVLAPEELYAQLETPRFQPGVITQDARLRAQRYRQEQHRRDAAHTFAGSREAFLRSCDIRLSIRRATTSDVPRVAELAERTHRFNTTGEPWPAARIAEIVRSPDWFVPVARVTDRYGDYGQVGTALVRRRPDGRATWRLRLFMVSCRAAGRDVPFALLRWLLLRARADAAERLLVDLRPSQANLELRVLLRRAGFTADGDALAGDAPGGDRPGGDRAGRGAGTVLLGRSVTGDLPAVPWLTVAEPDGDS